MPLGEAYDKMLKSEIADMKNVGGRPGGSISAACFIQRFTNGVPWAHLDIAGTAWSSKDAPTIPKGATAFGVRLIDRLVAEHYESDLARLVIRVRIAPASPARHASCYPCRRRRRGPASARAG